MVIIFDDRMDIWISFVIESIESVFYDCIERKMQDFTWNYNYSVMRDINNCFTKKEKRRRRKKALTRVIKQRAREIGRLRCLPRERQRTKHTRGARSFIFPVKTLWFTLHRNVCFISGKIGGGERRWYLGGQYSTWTSCFQYMGACFHK